MDNVVDFPSKGAPFDISSEIKDAINEVLFKYRVDDVDPDLSQTYALEFITFGASKCFGERLMKAGKAENSEEANVLAARMMQRFTDSILGKESD